MPRISLWKPEKGNDYKFIDNIVAQHYRMGGTGVWLHKYLGIFDQGTVGGDEPEDLTQQGAHNKTADHKNKRIPETTIQDVLFLENRDRQYDENIYDLRGVYNPADADFDLTQFGLFLANDIILMTFHMNETINRIGRKLMSGDVLELPHIADDTGLDNSKGPIPKFYVVEDVSRGAEGFDPMWWPHITRVNAKALQDTVEFRDILGDGEAVEDLQHLLSTFDNEIEISEDVLAQAQAEVPKVGYETRHLYISKDHKPGVFTGDGSPPNGALLVGSGPSFPDTPAEGDYFLRTDFNPHRLFIRKGTLWTKVEDDVRRSWQAANAIVTTFISNTGTITSSGEVDSSKQGLSRALKPRADF